MEKNKRIGLSLSGGGYRAAAFHLGTLKKLNDLGILSKVDVLSTISGGSITGAAYAIHQGNYSDFHSKMRNDLSKKNVVSYILTSFIFLRAFFTIGILLGIFICLTFTKYAHFTLIPFIILIVLLWKFQFKIFPVSKVIEKAYDKFFYDRKTLKDLSANLTMAIGSSNLHTGRPFTFSKHKMSDSDYSHNYDPPIEFIPDNFPISSAVMASSCVPFAFTPIFIDEDYYVKKENCKKVKPTLVDGGVYDNQGIQKLTQKGSSYECDIIITSDAGGNFKKNSVYANTIKLLLRTVDLFMYRIKAFQMQKNLYNNTNSIGRPIAYFSLGWKLENLISGFYNSMQKGGILQEIIDAHNFDPLWLNNPVKYKNEIIDHLKKNTGYDVIKENALKDSEWEIAQNIGTNLTSIPLKKIDYLIQHASDLTEIQIRLYCPFLCTPLKEK